MRVVCFFLLRPQNHPSKASVRTAPCARATSARRRTSAAAATADIASSATPASLSAALVPTGSSPNCRPARKPTSAARATEGTGSLTAPLLHNGDKSTLCACAPAKPGRAQLLLVRTLTQSRNRPICVASLFQVRPRQPGDASHHRRRGIVQLKISRGTGQVLAAYRSASPPIAPCFRRPRVKRRTMSIKW